jgi:hypothetical protein
MMPPGQRILDLAGLDVPQGSICEAWLGNAAAALCPTPEAGAAFWRALWRAMAHGGRVELRLRPDDPVAPGGATLRDARAAGALHHMPLDLAEMRALCERVWCLDMDAPAPFAVAQGLSFALVGYEPTFSHDTHRAIKRGKSSQAGALSRAQDRTGIVSEHAFTLIANKQITSFQEVRL